jgi:hypothetical protein
MTFPCPEDEDDFARWERNQWDPGLLALRVTQLGDHAATIPWDRTLRGVWKYRYDQLSDEQRENPAVGCNLTASQLAGRSFLTLMAPMTTG